MEISLLLIGITFLMAIIVLSAAIKIVAEHQRLVIFRLGRFVGVFGPGINFTLPVLDKTVLVDLREQTRQTTTTAHTQDEMPLSITLSVLYKITDPAKSVLAVENLENAVVESATSAFQSVIGERRRADVFAQRADLKTQALERLRPVTDPWGVAITNLEIDDIQGA